MSGTMWNNSQFNPESQTRGSDFQDFFPVFGICTGECVRLNCLPFSSPILVFPFHERSKPVLRGFFKSCPRRGFQCHGGALLVQDPDGGSDPVQRDQGEQSRFQYLKSFAIARDEHHENESRGSNRSGHSIKDDVL